MKRIRRNYYSMLRLVVCVCIYICTWFQCMYMHLIQSRYTVCLIRHCFSNLTFVYRYEWTVFLIQLLFIFVVSENVNTNSMYAYRRTKPYFTGAPKKRLSRVWFVKKSILYVRLIKNKHNVVLISVFTN